MKTRDFAPLIMGLILLSGIIALALARSGRAPDLWKGYPFNWDNVFVCSYIAWLLVELRVSKKDVNTEGRKTADFATCQIYGVGQALTFLSALWFPSAWQAPGPAHFAGLTIFLLAVCYRLWAVRTLGRFYSHRVRISARHRIVDSGPYRYTRHPAYAGMILANAGISIYFLNWVTVSIFTLILFPAVLFRIFIEERTLYEVEGYPEFAEKRKRLLPGFW